MTEYPDRAASLPALISASPTPLKALASLLRKPGTQWEDSETQAIMQKAEQDLAQRGGTDNPSDNLYEFSGPLPTVRTFARYLVIAGVVMATVWMSLAAYSVVMGSRDGAARVIGAAAGLIMLLCAYTIWKIVQMNTFGANSATPAESNSRPYTAQASEAYVLPPDLPATPTAAPSTPHRPGIPLVPLGASINR